MKKLIGVCIIAMILSSIFGATVWVTGLMTALIVWGTAIAVTALFMVARCLIEGN